MRPNLTFKIVIGMSGALVLAGILLATKHFENGGTVAAHPEVINKIVMVMLTIRDDNGNTTGYKQFHGPIVRMNDKDGIVVLAKNKEEISLPPQLAALQPAFPGEYTESNSGDVIKDPDYLSVWDVTAHSKENGGGNSWKYHGPIEHPPVEKEHSDSDVKGKS